ncbi:hypothetical protein ACG6P0_002687 [Enterococcus hirae]|uniref:Uncharacterized protein n=1 Tax=Enterococcus casseliflavus TaxID=37734 RepID=A0AAW8URM6_ENTCA|nr:MULTISPECIES: hypothetical protein [Enterococcus]NSV17717.1 hypothetical protein [Enterococcus faecalis]OQO71754.1 hypothetical protein BH744_13670 [Enterococcus villorum]EGP0013639.1 hypothetical protein [Enterococcus faecium]EGP4729459.1 hypothetical protein [Enterococcus faecium]EME3501431.1 hypothetical protein [Enterococcus faecium]
MTTTFGSSNCFTNRLRKALLLSIIKVKKEEKESYIKALTNSFDLEDTFIQETLNKLAERPKTDTQLDLFSYDTG